MQKLTVAEVHGILNEVLCDLEDLFVPGMKLTFIARMPGKVDQSMMVTNDPDIAELSRTLDHLKNRDIRGQVRN